MRPLLVLVVSSLLATPAGAKGRRPHKADSMDPTTLSPELQQLLGYCLHLATSSSGFAVSETEALSPFVCLLAPDGKTSSDVLVGKHADQVREYLGNLFAQIPAEMGTPAVVTSGKVKHGEEARSVIDVFVLSADRKSAVHWQGLDVPQPPPTPSRLQRVEEVRLTIKK